MWPSRFLSGAWWPSSVHWAPAPPAHRAPTPCFLRRPHPPASPPPGVHAVLQPAQLLLAALPRWIRVQQMRWVCPICAGWGGVPHMLGLGHAAGPPHPEALKPPVLNLLPLHPHPEALNLLALPPHRLQAAAHPHQGTPCLPGLKPAGSCSWCQHSQAAAIHRQLGGSSGPPAGRRQGPAGRRRWDRGGSVSVPTPPLLQLPHRRGQGGWGPRRRCCHAPRRWAVGSFVAAWASGLLGLCLPAAVPSLPKVSLGAADFEAWPRVHGRAAVTACSACNSITPSGATDGRSSSGASHAQSASGGGAAASHRRQHAARGATPPWRMDCADTAACGHRQARGRPILCASTALHGATLPHGHGRAGAPAPWRHAALPSWAATCACACGVPLTGAARPAAGGAGPAAGAAWPAARGAGPAAGTLAACAVGTCPRQPCPGFTPPASSANPPQRASWGLVDAGPLPARVRRPGCLPRCCRRRGCPLHPCCTSRTGSDRGLAGAAVGCAAQQHPAYAACCHGG